MDNKVKHIFNLGFLYEKSHTLFRLWAPSADEVFLRLYEQGDGRHDGRIFLLPRRVRS